MRNPRFGILVNAPDLWTSLETIEGDFADVGSGNRNDMNWWCPFETDRQLIALRADFNGNSGIDLVDEYSKDNLVAVFDQTVRDRLDAKREALLKQHPMVKAVNWKEIRALASMPGAPQAAGAVRHPLGQGEQGR